MPTYRRHYVPGGVVFLTVVTHERAPVFADAANVQRLRDAIRATRAEWPFEFTAAVVLPDHLHFLWTLPEGDGDFSKRVGRMKAKFTSALGVAPSPNASRAKHRERGVWQRRFWDHVIRDEDDLKQHLDYIHFNPVKHGHATCPHGWPHSSFPRWVATGDYPSDWGCSCGGSPATLPDLDRVARAAGE